MKRAQLIVFLIFVLGAANPLLAQTPTPSPASSPSLTAEALLNHAIELTGQLDQRLLTTVYWCLGILVTVFVVLIGYNWFTSFRTQKREVAALRQEIQADLDVLKKETAEHIQKMARDSTNDIRSSLKAYVQSQLASLKSSIGHLQALTLANERDEWRAKGVPLNALRKHMDYLRQVKQTGYEWQFQRGLDTLQQILKDFNSGSVKPDAEEIAACTKFLTEIEKENPVIVASIKSLLSEIRK